MAFSFNKLFPRIPPLPPKTQFIKSKFVNQGLDLLNISNIFRDHRVTSKIPQYFDNLDPPLICYQYKSPIRNIIFNYNQVVDMLSPMTLLVFLMKDYGLSLRKGLNTDFHSGLILPSAGILSRMHFRRIVNVGPKRNVSECMPLTTGKMNFYAFLT